MSHFVPLWSREAVPPRPRVIIIGAGISGLTCARSLLQNSFPPEVIVLEARQRLGGRAYTFRGLRGRASGATEDTAFCPVDLGCSWFHKEPQNKLSKLMRAECPVRLHASGERFAGYDIDGRVLDEKTFARVWESKFKPLVQRVAEEDKKRRRRVKKRERARQKRKKKMKSQRQQQQQAAVPRVEQPISLHTALESAYASKPGLRAQTPEEKLALHYCMCHVESYDGGELHDLATRDLEGMYLESSSSEEEDEDEDDEDEEVEYDDALLLDGYARVVDHLSRDLPAGCVRLGHQVTCVDWPGPVPAGQAGQAEKKKAAMPGAAGALASETDKEQQDEKSRKRIVVHVTTGKSPAAASSPSLSSPATAASSSSVLEADFVVVTVPIGVLQRGSVAFRPALPSWKQQAIAGVAMGAMEKVVLAFDPAVKPFWQNSQPAAARDWFGFGLPLPSDPPCPLRAAAAAAAAAPALADGDSSEAKLATVSGAVAAAEARTGLTDLTRVHLPRRTAWFVNLWRAHQHSGRRPPVGVAGKSKLAGSAHPAAGAVACGTSVLVTLLTGRLAEQLRALSDVEAVALVMARLRVMFGGKPAVEQREGKGKGEGKGAVSEATPDAGIPDPIAFKVTRWRDDPLACGAYPHCPPGSSYKAFEALGRPVACSRACSVTPHRSPAPASVAAAAGTAKKQRLQGERKEPARYCLFWAGDATSGQDWGSADVAYRTGRRAAKQVWQEIGKEKFGRPL